MQNLLQNKPLIGEDVSWLRELRQKGHESFSLPDAKTEYWRYTKLHDIRNTDYVMDVPFYKVKPVNVGLEGYILYFLNGSFSPQHSNLPQGVEVMPLIEAVFTVPEAQKYLGKIADAKIHPFAALNQAYLNEGIYIKIEKNIELKKPLILVHHTHNEGESLFYNLHNLIVLEENAKASLLEYYTYSGQIKSRYFGNHVNEIILAKGAGLNHYKFQDEAFYAVHIAVQPEQQIGTGRVGAGIALGGMGPVQDKGLAVGLDDHVGGVEVAMADLFMLVHGGQAGMQLIAGGGV